MERHPTSAHSIRPGDHSLDLHASASFHTASAISAAAYLSHHARKRMKQRAIPLKAVDALLSHGEATRCGGADRIVFRRPTARGRDSLPSEIERWRGIYAVIADDGHIITVGHRTRRFHRN